MYDTPAYEWVDPETIGLDRILHNERVMVAKIFSHQHLVYRTTNPHCYVSRDSFIVTDVSCDTI